MSHQLPLKSHDYFMEYALNLAQKGRGQTAPNPIVGCIIVKNNQIIGAGYHRKAGFNHAEIEALESCIKNGHKNNIIDSIVYVTLEPCCHIGKTGPCVEALIKHQIKTVVIAIKDPNPLVAGLGIDKLQTAGIEVILGVCAVEAYDINKGFFTRITKNRPFIRSKIAASLDGKIALKNGESKWITNEECRQDVHLLRSYSDAIVTTAQTVIADNPAMTVRMNEQPIEHSKYPIRIVLDQNLATDPAAKIYQDQQLARTIIITTKRCLEHKSNADKLQIFRNNKIDIIALGDDLNIVTLWQFLAELDCNDVLIEAGGRFNAYLLTNKLVDEWVIYQSGLIMGNSAQNMFNYESNAHSLSGLFKLKCEHIKRFESDWRLTFSSENV